MKDANHCSKGTISGFISWVVKLVQLKHKLYNFSWTHKSNLEKKLSQSCVKDVSMLSQGFPKVFPNLSPSCLHVVPSDAILCPFSFQVVPRCTKWCYSFVHVVPNWCPRVVQFTSGAKLPQVVPKCCQCISSGAKWSSFTFPCGHKIFWVSASAFDIAAVAGMPVYIMLSLRTFVIWKGMLVCCWIRSRSGGVFDLKRGSDLT